MVQTQLTVEPFASKFNSFLERIQTSKIKFHSKILKRETLGSKMIPNCRSSSRALQLPLWTAKRSSSN
ncbi:Hypothetical protein FKW44_008472 [Caligus rogercresseyi]|uniref:Uncharacterized protein n=1 Tax=Caligus rogercresseyi TaxID=217165 RepID=A0A7T8KGG9_CALRO|nr:Hypothetical protein FKW44_008472 [Caligus rogercresseyi]